MTIAIKTVGAVYEKGYLRPLEPLEERPDLIYFVTVIDLTKDAPKPFINQLRGKYRGHISTSQEFAAQKKYEKEMEH